MMVISRAGIVGRILGLEVAVADLDVFQGLLQQLAKALSDVHRAVVAARCSRWQW